MRLSLLLLILCLAALPLAAADISGKWEFDVQTDAGAGAPSFVFKQAGETLTGAYNGLFGTAQLAGTVKGDQIEFTVAVSIQDQKSKIVYKGKILSASSMKGEVEITGLGKGTWTGSKKD
jgi:hypothetical protein